MFALFSAPPSARPSSRRLRAKKPELGVERLDKRQVLSAAPTVDIPDSFVVEQQQKTGLFFGSAPFADVDSPGSKRMTVTVQAASGTLTASSGSGVRVTGKGATRVFRGSLDNLNNYFSGAGYVYYRNNSEGAYSLSVRIAEKVGRRTLSSTDWATIHVQSAATAARVSSSSTVGFPPQLGSTPSTSSLSTWSSTPTTSWSSDYSSYPTTTSSWTSYPSTSSYSGYYYPSTSSYSSYYYPSTSSYSSYYYPSTSSYSSYYYPSTSSYSSYSYPSTSYSSYYPTTSWSSYSYPSTSWSSGYSSYPLTTSSWLSYPSNSTTDYFATAMNLAASRTQSLLNLQSTYNEIQSLSRQAAAMGLPTFPVPSSLTNLLFGSSGSSATGSALQFGSTNWGSPIQVGTVNWGNTIQLGTVNWGSAGYGLNFGPLFW